MINMAPALRKGTAFGFFREKPRMNCLESLWVSNITNTRILGRDLLDFTKIRAPLVKLPRSGVIGMKHPRIAGLMKALLFTSGDKETARDRNIDSTG